MKERAPRKNRREFLKGSAALVGAPIVGDIVGSKLHEITFPEKESVMPILEESTADWWKDVTYPTPPGFPGNKVTNLEWKYMRPADQLDVSPETYPEHLRPINFAENLARMFEEKLERVWKGNPQDAHRQAGTYKRLLKRYLKQWQNNELEKTSIEGITARLEQVQEDIKSQIANPEVYKALHDAYITYVLRDRFGEAKTPEEQVEHDKWKRAIHGYLKYTFSKVEPEMLIAFMATELFPVPSRAPAAIDFVARYGGLEFLESVPALGDDIESFGAFQLTGHVVGPRGNVTKMMRVLPGSMQHAIRLPENLSEFTSFKDHATAAYLLIVRNLIEFAANVAREGTPEDFLSLVEMADMPHVLLAQLASAHHRPALAEHITEEWVAARATDTEQSIETYLPTDVKGQQVRTYIQKATVAYDALVKRMGTEQI